MTELGTTIIRSVPNTAGGFDIDVQSELQSEEELIAVLLLLVERMTGVSTEEYVEKVDSQR